jgi:hypothetical protein
MKVAMWFPLVLFLLSGSADAGTWSGFLVDSGCFQMRENNVNPTDTDTYVDRDRGLEIPLCYPSRKTKRFMVVDQDGLSFRLDSSGNAKAAELFQKTARKKESYFQVVVTGEMSKDTVTVASISKIPPK